MARKVWLLLVACLSIGAQAGAQSNAGDNWIKVRGNTSPGTRYTAFVQTPSGRLLAAGNGGQVMMSDDGGLTWRYDVIRVGEDAFFGRITDMMVIGSSVVAIATRLVSSSNRFGLPFEGQTLLLNSTNNGDNWDIQTFPLTQVNSVFGEFPGVALSGLHLDVGGNLLAYGTTQVSTGVVTWSIGGAIFRKTGAWGQAFFELGPLHAMANGNGRVIAGGFQTLLDSPDGAAWNGYFLRDANVEVNGQVLDVSIRRKMSISDIAYQGGQFVIHAPTYVPISEDSNIFLPIIDDSYTLTSPNPFDGGRLLTGTRHPTFIYPFYQQRGGNLLSMFTSIDRFAGGGWQEVDPTLNLITRSYGPADSQSIIAIGSSEDVWRSDDAGDTWDQLLDLPLLSDLIVQTQTKGTLFATEDRGGVWVSTDNGLTWTERGDFVGQVANFPANISARNGRLFAGTGDGNRIAISDDLGFTWQPIDLPAPRQADLETIFTGYQGRMIAAPEGRPPGIDPIDQFYYSDNNGDTWTEVDVPIQFQEFPVSGTTAGGNRLIFVTNNGASIRPGLIVSDDNGLTWYRTTPFDQLDDLNTVFGDETQVALQLRQIAQSTSGRLLIRGSDEILTSDDRGDTWQVRLNLDLRNSRGEESNLLWRIHDLQQIGNRWLALGSRRSRPFGPNDGLKFALISDDDGATWREKVLPADEDQELEFLMLGLDGRVLASGDRGGVFITDFEAVPSIESKALTVREGEQLIVEIPRPPVPGAFEANYYMTGVDAVVAEDFVASEGELSWADGELTPKTVILETVDDNQIEPEEALTIDFYVESAVLVSTQFIVYIQDDDGTGFPGITLIAGEEIRTTEDGDADTFALALTSAPSAEVTVTLTNEDPGEVSLSTNVLTFTPGDWNVAQEVTAIGVDDSINDRDVTATIRLSTTSGDAGYEDVGLRLFGIVNADNDEVIFQDFFE